MHGLCLVAESDLHGIIPPRNGKMDSLNQMCPHPAGATINSSYIFFSNHLAFPSRKIFTTHRFRCLKAFLQTLATFQATFLATFLAIFLAIFLATLQVFGSAS